MGLEGSAPSNALSWLRVKGSSFGGAISVLGGCMTELESEAAVWEEGVDEDEEAVAAGCLRLRSC